MVLTGFILGSDVCFPEWLCYLIRATAIVDVCIEIQAYKKAWKFGPRDDDRDRISPPCVSSTIFMHCPKPNDVFVEKAQT